MNSLAWLTLLIALYGAVLSTIIFWRERQKEKRTIRVECRIAIGLSPSGTPGRYVSIVAVNSGHRPVTIIQAGLKLNTKESYIPMVSNPVFYPLPKKLEDSDPVTILMEWDNVLNSLSSLKDNKVRFTKAFVQDAEGNIYSAPLPRALKELSVAQ